MVIALLSVLFVIEIVLSYWVATGNRPNNEQVAFLAGWIAGGVTAATGVVLSIQIYAWLT